MHFLKKQDFNKKIFFYIFFLFINSNYLFASPTEEDLKNISSEIYNLILQAKSTFENGDILSTCNIAYAVIIKWKNLDINQIEPVLIDKYYLIDSLLEQNKSKLDDICLIENSMNP